MEEHLTLLPHGLQRLRHRPEVHVQLLKMGLHWEQSTATCCCISSAAAAALPGGLFASSGTVWFTNTPRQEDTDAPLLPPPPPPPGRPRCSYPMQRPLVPGDEPRPLTEQGPFHLLVHKLYGDDWHAQLMAFTVCHPAVPVVDAKFLKRVFSVDTLVKPHPPVIAYSVSHNINFFRIFIQFWDEEGIANTQMSLGLGNDDGSRQCADCGQTKFL